MKARNFALKYKVIMIIVCSLSYGKLSAQFVDNFNSNSIKLDKRGVNGWTFFTGDGSAVMDFYQSRKGYASIYVDATKDKRCIWWAIIRRCVSHDMELSLLSKPNYEFRIEARIKVSSAPKRVNLHLNTQRTTNFHSHLMEYDIPDTTNWHTISMTTHNFDALPGDTIYGQLALMDWGLDKYHIDVDYFKVDIVNVDSIGPDEGVKLPYHPSIDDVNKFDYHIPVAQDAMIDLYYTDMNFNNWSANNESWATKLLTVSGTQYLIMQWDLSKFAGKEIDGSGLLELTSYSLQRSPTYQKDFGMVRVSEIIGGKNNWSQETVTYNNFSAGQTLDNVINSQMIIDIDVKEKEGSKNYITISKPVLQRMIDGKTFGLAIRPLGAVIASFYSLENNQDVMAKLHFNIIK